jgi:hypothetical protein
MNGVILYRGPSMIDGAPIVCIATGLEASSRNSKTGALIQTWIVREDIAPHIAAATGEDSSVCGDCMHRPSSGGACYVKTFQAPLSVWRAFHRGAYPLANESELALLRQYNVRAGSYGDPAAVPLAVWETVGVRTGYTHQWRRAPKLASLAMASVDTPAEAVEAVEAGWRYFRVRPEGAPLLSGEIDCPSKRGVSCVDCGLCAGNQRKAKNISIEVHGATKARFARKLAVLQ